MAAKPSSPGAPPPPPPPPIPGAPPPPPSAPPHLPPAPPRAVAPPPRRGAAAAAGGPAAARGSPGPPPPASPAPLGAAPPVASLTPKPGQRKKASPSTEDFAEDLPSAAVFDHEARAQALEEMAALERALELEIDAGAALEDEGPSRDASVADSEEDAYDRARLLETAELCRMRLAEHDQRVLERAASFDDCECPLSTVLRGVLFARGRRIAGDGIASDWARSLLLCVFRCHAGPDKRWGLEEWCCFVADCKFPSEDAPRLFRRVALQRAAAAVGGPNDAADAYDSDASDDDGDGDGVAALVAAGVHDVRFEFGGFYRLLEELAASRLAAADGDSAAPRRSATTSSCPWPRRSARGARTRAARRASTATRSSRSARRSCSWRRTCRTSGSSSPCTRRTSGATRRRGQRVAVAGAGLPHLAQAAEHAVAGVELRDPASVEFGPRARDIEATALGSSAEHCRSVALALNEDRFLRLCEDLALVPAVATAALGRKCYKDARKPRLGCELGEAASPAKKRASPTKKPRPHFQSPILRTTAAHRRRMLATASQTSSLHATRDGHARATPRSKAVRANVSLALEQTKARGPRSVASTLAREIDLTTEACPGLSFCEFVDALLSVADGAIGARGRLKALYPTPHDRAVALLAVWGAADPNKFDLVAGCVASHCHANTGEHR
ncbi:hypothetical protein JL721_6383 [Aureococcus anophagefferens]|nr:hypothetical protein JL721_6383 [Aureococcus anophagefferens]